MNSSHAHPPYRADIDGLRAVAIVAVIGFHYFQYWFIGGFIGVDIFFVLSGFLITQILLGAAPGGKTLLAFYGRRIRRIFPVLALVLVTVVAAGWFLLYREEFAGLGTHVAGGAGFVSNLVLWRESGYFDTAIETKPLAHLWSLGVEEQFYILWPPLLWLCAGRRHGLHLVGALAALSLLAGVSMLQFDALAAFYLPTFRFWELIAGALLATALRESSPAWLPARGNLVSAVGLLLLTLSIVLIDSSSAFPGWWAVLPVAGTCLVIAAGPQAWGNRLLLTNRPVVFIGLISFSLYLWHWPLLAFARIVFNAEPQLPGMLLLLAVCVALSCFTYRWVETPLRAPGAGPAKTLALCGVMLAVLLAGWTIQRSGGFPERKAQQRFVAFEDGYEKSPYVGQECGLADPSLRPLVSRCARDLRDKARFALVGDSKAEVLFPSLVRTSTESGRWLFIGGALAHTQMVPLLSDAPAHRRHQAALRLVLETLARNPDVEVVAVVAATRALFQLRTDVSIDAVRDSSQYVHARDGLLRFTSELLRAGKGVVLVVDNPTLPDPRRCLVPARIIPPEPLTTWFGVEAAKPECSLPLQRHLTLAEPYLKLLREVRDSAPGRIQIFDTTRFLCDADTGICGPTDGKRVLYSYSDHVSDYAGGRIGQALNLLLASHPASTDLPSR